MKKILATLILLSIFTLGSIYLAVGQQPSIYPISPFTEKQIFEKELQIKELSAAPSQVANYGKLYVLASDGHLYFKDDSGSATDLTTGGGAGTVDTSGTPVDNDFAKFTDADTIEGRSYSETKDDLGLNTTDDPTFNDLTVDKVEANESFTYDAVQTATGDGTTTVNWGLGNLMYFTFGAQNDTFTFTAPPGPAIPLVLWLKQDGTGSRTATWPATVHWPGDVIPTLSTGANDVDIVTFAWDGTNYFGLFNGNFY